MDRYKHSAAVVADNVPMSRLIGLRADALLRQLGLWNTLELFSGDDVSVRVVRREAPGSRWDVTLTNVPLEAVVGVPSVTNKYYVAIANSYACGDYCMRAYVAQKPDVAWSDDPVVEVEAIAELPANSYALRSWLRSQKDTFADLRQVTYLDVDATALPQLFRDLLGAFPRFMTDASGVRHPDTLEELKFKLVRKS